MATPIRKRKAVPVAGLHVWELRIRPKGPKGGKTSMQPYLSAPLRSEHPFRFSNLADAQATIRRYQEGNGNRGVMLYDVQVVSNFLPGVKALTECYCENCGIMTAAYPSDHALRRLVTSCNDCKLKNWDPMKYDTRKHPQHHDD